MDWKQFLKPDWKKILLTVILFLISTRYVSFLGLDAPYYIGFPINVYYMAGWPMSTKGFFYLGIVIDLIFYYLISCLIVWIYDKVRKKRIR
jgi:hypothetical protein